MAQRPDPLISSGNKKIVAKVSCDGSAEGSRVVKATEPGEAGAWQAAPEPHTVCHPARQSAGWSEGQRWG